MSVYPENMKYALVNIPDSLDLTKFTSLTLLYCFFLKNGIFTTKVFALSRKYLFLAFIVFKIKFYTFLLSWKTVGAPCR